ncbi:MAG TPA: antitoxin family protein [Tepidisphaeraceae bacterium]|nr:antitoxin family protein [Tepidisphaeraceae bacterium]
MTQTVEAIYRGGVFKPVQPIEGIEENSRVTVTVAPAAAGHPLAGWKGGLSDAEAVEMTRAIESEFERIDENEWR